MRLEVLLLCVAIFIGVLSLAAIVTILLEVRTILRRRERELSQRPDEAVRMDELQDLQNEVRSIHTDVRALRAALTEGLRAASGKANAAQVPLATLQETRDTALQGSMALSLDEAARRLVEECDAKPVERLSDVPGWIREQSYRLEAIAGTPDDWFLAVLTSEGESLVVPNMRRPMGRIDLGLFFDFVNYNGVDPLREEKVSDFARVTRTGSGWSVTKKGLIHG
jgi:hypothetical protein